MDTLPSLFAALSGNPKLMALLQDPAHQQRILLEPGYLQQLLVNQLTNATPPPAPAGTQQSSPAAPALVPQKEMLLRLYDEFVQEDDEGKQLAANLGRFARYVQSKASKAPAAAE